MTLSSFTVGNYRAFVQATTIELRPLTLLFGYNNSGKSALLRFLPLIAESTTGRWPGHLALDSPPAREASYDDLCNQQSGTKHLTFRLRGALHLKFDITECTYHLTCLPDSRHFISGFTTSWNDPLLGAAQTLHARASDTLVPADTLVQEMTFEFEGPTGQASLGPIPLAFRGLAPNARPAPVYGPYASMLDLQADFLDELGSDVQWLGAFRTHLRRRIPRGRTGVPPRKLAYDGTGAAEILAFDSERGGQLVERVEAWFRGDDLAPEHRLIVKPEAEDVRLRLSPWHAPGVEVDLIDAGEGITQVLPVLVALARAARGAPGDPRLVAVEQPELHLRPRREIALARYLATIAQAERPPTILLETHSENLLLALQLEVVAGRLDPSRVGIYWIRQMEDGSSVAQPLPVDAMARIEGWPRGVFEEDTDLARRLVAERLKQESKDA